MLNSQPPSCILCNHPQTKEKATLRFYTYYSCGNCGLIFADPSQRLSLEEEKQRYDHHQNNPDDPGYRKFLNRIFEPLSARLQPASCGLDYGSGPGPTLHIMFEEAGHRMNIYDPFYAPDRSVLNLKYDFITVTETAEHFYKPVEEFEKLWEMLNPCGYLGIMTLLVSKNINFEKWHYNRDDTHVSFYSEGTFQWLANRYGAIAEFFGDRVVLLRKE